ncbi:hypothetical protein [Amorphus sp. 3PC139-8]|uniref:hypothetical protein n=1 Tax=Amorphus sp. 3PC139-8 TaxID=2735676 RepID=UPI00345DBEBB
MAGLDDGIDELVDLRVDPAHLISHHLDLLPGERRLPFPSILEHDGGDLDELLAGAQGLEKVGKAALDLGARNGLAVDGAALLAAEIIRIALVLTFGPTRR